MKTKLWISMLFVLGTGTTATADVPTYQLDAFLDAPGCSSVDLSPDKARIYARYTWGAWDEGYVAFDANTGTKVQEYRFGLFVDSAPWTGRISADSAYLYYTTYYGGAVKKRDVAEGNVASTIPVGPWPVGLAFDSQRRYLYVGVNDPGTGAIGSIQKIDTTTDSVVGEGFTLNGEPGVCIQVSPDDQYVFAISRIASPEILYKIRTSDMQEVGSIPLAGIGDAGFSLSPDGSVAYVPEASANNVHVIETATMAEIDVWNVQDPKGFYVSPDGTHALVLSDEPSIRIFDLPSGSVIQTVSLGNVGTMGDSGRQTPYWNWNGGSKVVYIAIAGTSEQGVAVLIAEQADSQQACDDFEDGVIDAALWEWGGLNRTTSGGQGGPWEWSHEEVIDPDDGYLSMHVSGPGSGLTFGAEAWVRTLYDYNDGANHVIDFTWEADVADFHYNRYFIQVTDGYISPDGNIHWSQEPSIPGTTNLLWRLDGQGNEFPGAIYPTSEFNADWSMSIDSSGVVQLYDDSGSLLRERSLDDSYPWYVRLMVVDATSSGFPAGDIRLNLYEFCAPSCTTNLHCDDGDECNGIEICNAAGDCEAGVIIDCNENGVDDECDQGICTCLALGDVDRDGTTCKDAGDLHAMADLLESGVIGPEDYCTADLNEDGQVSFDDLHMLIDLFECPADLDCDGQVRVPDLIKLLADWGQCMEM